MKKTQKNRIAGGLLLLCIALVLVSTRSRVIIWLKGPPRLETLNVLVLLIDTVNTEHLGCYTPGLTFTPNIDRLAREGVRFSHAYSAAPWTKPAIASLLTGVMPSTHHVERLGSRLSTQFRTMAEELQSRGYVTAGFVSHNLLAEKHGYARGFDTYEQLNTARNVDVSVVSRQVSNAAIIWMNENVPKLGEKHFFLLAHYFDPHYNYQHHEQFDMTSWYKGTLKPGHGIFGLRERLNELTTDDVRFLRDLYREEIAFVDHHIGRVLRHLEKLEIDDKTLVIFLADHGEEFMRHGWIGHTRTLYDELVRIPMIFRLPGGLAPRIVDDEVSQLDIFPTLLGLSEDPSIDAKLEGLSLVPLLAGRKASTETRTVFSEVDYLGRRNVKTANKAAAIRDPWKLIHDRRNGSFELYNRTSDPEELHDLLAPGPPSSDETSAGENGQSAGSRRASSPLTSVGAVRPGETEWKPVLLELRRQLDAWENPVSGRDRAAAGKTAGGDEREVNEAPTGEREGEQKEGQEKNEEKAPMTDEEIEQLKSLGYL